MPDLKAVTRVMGGNKIFGSPESEFELIELIRLGLPASIITSLVNESEVPRETLAKGLRIPNRTLARNIQEKKKLSPRDSERAYRFGMVWVKAVEVLGSDTKARHWILAENRALGGNPPIELLDTGIGFEDVIAVLHRIEFGVYS